MRLFRKYEFYISEASREDYLTLAKIHDGGFDVSWSEDEMVATLAAKGTVCYVANIQGKGNQGPKGFIILRTLAGQSEVLTIATDPDFRKLGIARALLEHTIRQLQSERIGQLFLEVSEQNQPALNLYKSLAFKQVGERKAYYRPRPTIEAAKQAGETGPGAPESVPEGANGGANALVMQLELR